MNGTRLPQHVVALGGGTGLPAVLRGFRRRILDREISTLTAIVTMTDDGGSSGRLRRTRGIPPPGDVRNCLVALANEEDLLADLFQHRYDGREEIGGHSLGNLILAALAEQTGSFLRAVEVSSRVLRTAGRILPATLQDVVLQATMEDGSKVSGETSIAASRKRIRRISLQPPSADATPGIIDAIEGADVVVLGPGSLFTSVIPNLAVSGVVTALRRTAAVRVLVANLVSEDGRTTGMSLADHLDMLEKHAGTRVVDAVLVNDAPIPTAVLERYEAEGATPLYWPSNFLKGVPVVHRTLLAEDFKLRHDPEATAAGVVTAWNRLRRQARFRAARKRAGGGNR